MCWSVSGSVCLVCCVFDSLCELFEQFAIWLLFCCLMLWKCCSVGGVALFDRSGIVFQKMCVLCLMIVRVELSNISGCTVY